MLTSRTFDELPLGASAHSSRTITAEDLRAFAALSGDGNPAHLDAAFAAATPFRAPIAHGMFAAGLLSALLGTRMPGPGTIYLNQSLSFRRPLYVGDILTLTVTVSGRNEAKRWLCLDCLGTNQRGETVLKGLAEVMPPAEHRDWPEPVLPQLVLQDSGKVHPSNYPD